MIQVSEIDQEHRQYYEYLNRNYNEIVAYLQENDGSMDPHKRDLFFDKISLPFVIWKESKGVTQARPDREIDQDERKSWMLALEKKYGLDRKDGKYPLKSPLSRDKFRELAGKMKEAGFVYDSEKKGFVEVKH